MIVFRFFIFAFLGLVHSSYYYPVCQEGSTSYDKCGHRCTCVGGRLENCTRIRKEFTTLTYAERKRHINAILEVSKDQSKYRAEYENLINEHYLLFTTLIHEKQHFLPWHRYFLLRYENLLRKIDCTFTAAYWDWSLDTREPFSTDHWTDVWHSSEGTGYGGNGDPEKDLCVQTGPFKQGKWSRVRPWWAGSGPHCLRRNFTGDPPEEVDVEEVLKNDTFDHFESALRLELHNDVHCNINGVMCSDESASAPEFFLHHAFIDKIWDDWQKKSEANKNAYFPTLPKWQPLIGTNLLPSQLIDLSNQPGGVRVEYEPYAKEEKIRAELKGKSIAQLRHVRRRPFTGLSEQAIRVFQLSPDEVKMVRAIEKWLDPNVIEPKAIHWG